MELKIDETNRELGKQRHTCKICGETGDFESFLAREMMQGTKEEFVYFACARCGCLQIAEVPENLGDYYGSGYYSFQIPENPDMKYDTPVTNRTKVLDVGCGAGAWLLQKAQEGWGNLYGCDPFLNHDRRYGSRVNIKSCSIHEMEGDGTFDVIRMGDSFEHMADPLETLVSAGRLLKEGGVLHMMIPTYPNIAFDRFGPHWYQLDAPRHLFLHSKESLSCLAKKSGLVLSDLRYHSTNVQFVCSYFYQRGVPLGEQNRDNFIWKHLTSQEADRMQLEAEAWDERGRGDHMEVFFRKPAALAKEGNGRKVIFMRLPKKENGHTALFSPICRQTDADYLCFTDDERLTSSVWNIRLVENPGQADVDDILSRYTVRWEMKPDQIQMAPLSDSAVEENLVTVPKLRAAGNPDYAADSESGSPLHTADFEPGRQAVDSLADEKLASLLQLADEDKQKSLSENGQDRKRWMGLYALIIALSKESGDECRGKIALMELFSGLYHLKDRRLFIWSDNLEGLFPLTAAECAFLDWCRMHLAFRLERPAEKALAYYASYEEHLRRYLENPEDSNNPDFSGLAMVEQESYRMEAKVIAFCCYMRTGEKDRALQLLPELSPDMAADCRAQLFLEGLAAEDEVCDAVLLKLSPFQWEEWSGELLDAFLDGLLEENMYRKFLKRLPAVCSRLSVPAILSWLGQSKERRIGIAGRRLLAYAMECGIQNGPVQVLALVAWLLKETCEQCKEEEKKKLLPRYITVMGAFAGEYYNSEQLQNIGSRVIAPDILAAYRMAAVCADGKASSENVVALKQALELFPPFHEEIRDILVELK